MESESSYSKLQKDILKQDKEIAENNAFWRRKLDKMLLENWKNPVMKGAITDALDSIKHTES